MQYIITILIALAIAALAGWLVQRDSHKKSLTILTVAVIVAFAIAATGALNYAATHPSSVLNEIINEETGEAVEHDLDGVTLTLDSIAF